MKLLAALLAMSALASCGANPAYAANIPVSGLPARGTPATTDLVPVLPVGATTLEQTTVGALVALAPSGVGISLNSFSGVDPTGVTDSTTAIAAAIATGQSLTCDGLYKISAGFSMNATANHGQQIVGVGPTNQGGGVSANRCIFKPASGFTGFVFTVDGTATGQYITGWGFENLSVDLTNVSDVATNGAFHTVQAYDGHYTNVRVTNDGNYKRALLEGPAQAGYGATFTTVATGFYGNWVDLEGTSVTAETTTTMFVNADIGQITTNYAGLTTMVGGAVQFSYITGVTPVLWVPAGQIGPYSLGSTSTGYYLAYQTDLKNTQFFHIYNTDFEASNQPPHTCTSGTYSGGTYNDGTHGCAPIYMSMYIESTAFDTVFSAGSPSGMYIYDLGLGTELPSLSQNGVYPFAVHNRATGADYFLSDIRSQGNISGVTGFGGALGTETATTYQLSSTTGTGLFQGFEVRPASDGAYSFTINSRTGNLNQLNFTTSGTPGGASLGVNGDILSYTFVGRPATDGSVLYLENAAGTPFMICSSNATVGLSNCGVGNGADWAGYSDSAFSVETYDMNAATGVAYFLGGIVNTAIGATSPSTGAFTTLSVSGGCTGCYTLPSATTSVVGGVALATGAQVITGTDTTHAVTPASLTSAQSVAANGYWDMPGGLYMEWGESGSVSANSSTGGAVTFPHACASAVYAITITPAQNMGTGGMALSYVTSVSTAGFTIFNSAPNAGPYYWQANCK